ncbi:Bifunctional xylanase/deacetylase precursor [uncultured Clostridium sp.]|uniref:polysaccharide deacetylase family protein n=1 Tax=uncultured Clostridium sp. TaxID=59620 RepID=UPI0008231F2E|nr:polysaccharide deacetylase family protein [uncultured Clostridium sp.]SCJ89573.1 Bifunctional xylanase/deacetylase precursor [uncultured Clostridium sp.]
MKSYKFKNKNRRSTRLYIRRRKMKLIQGITSVGILVIIIFSVINIAPRKVDYILQTAKIDKGHIKDERIQDNLVEINLLDNNGYLYLKDDPYADDATIVAENVKGLLNGSKSYPVRTDGKKIVYLTFDDGPSATNTPKILDVLDIYNVKATFFVLGQSIESNEVARALIKEEVKRGHAIANHTYSHDYSYLYPNGNMNVDNIVSDIEKNNKLLREVLGKDFNTRVIRFPGGYWSWSGRESMRDKMIENGYCNIDWNALNGDAEGKVKNSDELFQRTKESIERLGDNADSIVILMHDTYGKEETVKALPQVIEYLQGKGYEFRTIK